MPNLFYKQHRISVEGSIFEIFRGKMLVATGIEPFGYEPLTPSLLDRAKALIDCDFESPTLNAIRLLPPSRMAKLCDFEEDSSE